MSGTEVGAFDATGYRQHVLSTLRGASKLDLSDPFFIVDLPVDVDDTELIRARITAGVRAQIRSDLDEFGRLTGDSSRSATLWTFLGIAPTTSAEEIAARHAELTSENERRQHDHLMTIVANLLTYTRQHLMTGDAARYAASLIEDAKDRLRDTVADKVIVDGELNAADYEACVRKVIGFGFGLSSEQARLAVRRVGTELGATLAVAPAVDYLICPNCREPQPASGPRACRYCGADLYLRCPACGQQAGAAAVACPHCGTSFRAIQAAVDQLAAARAELGPGHPAAARAALAPAVEAARNAPALAGEVSVVSDALDRVIATAQSDWRSAERELASQRLYAAVDRLSRIARVAADVAAAARGSRS